MKQKEKHHSIESIALDRFYEETIIFLFGTLIIRIPNHSKYIHIHKTYSLAYLHSGA